MLGVAMFCNVSVAVLGVVENMICGSVRQRPDVCFNTGDGETPPLQVRDQVDAGMNRVAPRIVIE
jgi:hypothetical protein